MGTRASHSFAVFFSMIASCTCIYGDAAMQQRSSSAGLTLHFLLFVLAIAGISAGLSIHASAQTPPSASSAEGYILGPNDRIRLKVYGESDITGEYEISNTGQDRKSTRLNSSHRCSSYAGFCLKK